MIKKNCIVLVVALALMLCSCGKDNEKISDSTKPEVPVTPAPSQTSMVKMIEKLDALNTASGFSFHLKKARLLKLRKMRNPKKGLVGTLHLIESI